MSGVSQWQWMVCRLPIAPNRAKRDEFWADGSMLLSICGTDLQNGNIVLSVNILKNNLAIVVILRIEAQANYFCIHDLRLSLFFYTVLSTN
jgi:hypothetical protein